VNRTLVAAFCALAGLTATLFGWATAPVTTSVETVARRPIPALPHLERPDATAAAAAAGLSSENPPPPPPPKPKPPPKPAPPPPPDPGQVLSSEVSAVVLDRVTNQLSLVLQATAPARKTQVLKIGDQFMDGWKLTELTHRYAVISRRGESRRVTFY
jgi:hypothetical protein